ncbi:signal peptide peptidase SppA [Pseudoalteromonas spongiae]|uniref:signal peptide peptidase SppA n=1 Tax=Pseudoalteromonas spongiae TaxID=298657 RepID=UPI00026CCDA9|nr:signal peptide peptidase SppA [Pseudoalteromonas spongiae]ATC98802.1 protease IV [Pseudoalteromonas spongiae UST010723-006]
MVKKAFVGFWNILNFSRRLVLNILFFFILIALFVSIMSSEDEIIVEQDSALVLSLSGNIVEEKTYIDPVEAALNDSMGSNDEPPEVLLDDILMTIKYAAKDKKIKLLLLDLQKMQGAHLNKLKAIAAQLDKFKETGKKVYAYGDYYSQAQYYIASKADEILMHPYGAVDISGYATYPLYFKEAIDKLEISQHIFRVGTFKSAVEPLIRSNMSEAAKEANKAWLDALWLEYKTDVAAHRGFEITNFDEDMETYKEKFAKVNGHSGQFALQYKWVDQLVSKEALRQKLIAEVGSNESGKSFKQIAFNKYLKTLKPPFPIENPITDKVAVVVAKGNIVDGERKAGEIGGDSTAKLLRRARLNDKVKAVVLRIDSGGGSMFASEIIRAEVLALKDAGKPVIASMGSVAASGGYWIAANANEIWAAPSTITGSIGVFGTMMTFEKTLAKLGVYSDGVATTDMASFSMLRPLEPKLADVIQMSVESAYDRFLTVVSEARGMDKAEVDKVAQGRVWIGTKAKELGLVDALGNKQDAIKRAAELASLSMYDVITIEHQLTEQEMLVQKIFGESQAAAFVTAYISKDDYAPVKNSIMQTAHGLKQQVSSLEQFNDPNGVYAKCLVCTVSY